MIILYKHSKLFSIPQYIWKYISFAENPNLQPKKKLLLNRCQQCILTHTYKYIENVCHKYIHMHAYIYTCIYIYISIYLYLYLYIYLSVCLFIYLHIPRL